MIYLVKIDFYEDVLEIIKELKDKWEVSECIKSYGHKDTLVAHFFELNGIYIYDDICAIDMDHSYKRDPYYKDMYDKVKPFIRDSKLKNLGI